MGLGVGWDWGGSSSASALADAANGPVTMRWDRLRTNARPGTGLD